MCMFVCIMGKSRAKSIGRQNTSSNKRRQSESVTQMSLLFDSPSKAPPPNSPSTTSSTLTRKRITGNQEDPKFIRAPREEEVIFNSGKALHTNAIVQAIDDWLDILKDSGKEEEIEKTLLLRRKYKENGPETLKEWEKRSQKEERRKSSCENGCTVSLRL